MTIMKFKFKEYFKVKVKSIPFRLDKEIIYSVIREAGYEPLTEGKVRGIPIKIDDMNCASCAMRIEKALKSINGVKSATVNFAVKTATVKYDPNIISILDLRKAITDLGYTVVSKEEVDEPIPEVEYYGMPWTTP